jgi:purine nucleosidase
MRNYVSAHTLRTLFFIPLVSLSSCLLTTLCICQPPRPLIIDHDAGVDDFISCTLQLLYCPERVKAITIAPADSYIVPAWWVMKRLQNLLPAQSLHIPIGAGTCEGTNPFPSDWREHAWKLTELPVWGSKKISRQEVEAEFLHNDHIFSPLDVLSRALKESTIPVDVVETGPCTNIAELLTQCPELKNKINRMYIMGGALRIDGNVKEEPNKHNGSAEWNIYNNPEAFRKVLLSGIPITLISLDATQFTPIRQAFMKKLELQCNNEASQFVFQSLLSIKPVIDSGQYMFWDTLTSAVAIDPSLVRTEKVKIRVVLDGNAAGQTVEDHDHGYEVDLGVWADQERFEKLVLDILAGKMKSATPHATLW